MPATDRAQPRSGAARYPFRTSATHHQGYVAAADFKSPAATSSHAPQQAASHCCTSVHTLYFFSHSLLILTQTILRIEPHSPKRSRPAQTPFPATPLAVHTPLAVALFAG